MTKSEARKHYLSLRKEWSKEQINELSDQIIDQLTCHLDWQEYQNVHVFLPIEKNNEFNTYRLIEKLEGKGYNLNYWIPKVIPNTKTLNHGRYSKENVVVSKMGIPEPLETGGLTDLDVVIVPLLVVNSIGQRVGYGGGFYDQFLASLPTSTILCGVSFFDELDSIGDFYSGDHPIHCCAFPDRFKTY